MWEVFSGEMSGFTSWLIRYVMLAKERGRLEHKILKFIERQGGYASRAKIGVGIKYSGSEKNLRNILTSMVDRGLLTREGSNKKRVYRSIALGSESVVAVKNKSPAGSDKDTASKAKTSDDHSLFSEESLEKLKVLDVSLLKRPKVGFNFDFLTCYVPGETKFIPEYISKKLFAIGKKYEGGTNLDAATYAKKIFEKLLIDLSFNSSRLEGNEYSLLDTEKLLKDGEEKENGSITDKVMILNHKEAIQFIIDTCEEPINAFLFRNIHTALMQDLMANKLAVGKIRELEVEIGNSAYTPESSPHELTMALNLISEKAERIEDPFEQSVFLLLFLSYLQAFEDGNKRVARISANIPLIRANFCPNSFIETDENDYKLALRCFYETQETLPMVEVFMDSYIKSSERYDIIIGSSEKPNPILVENRKILKQIMGEVIREGVLLNKASEFIDKRIKEEGEGFSSEVSDFLKAYILTELEHLHEGKLVGLYVSEVQLKKWQRLQR